MVFYLGMKVLAWYIYLNGIKSKNIMKYTYPNVIKTCYIYIIDTQMVLNKNDTNPTLVITMLV